MYFGMHLPHAILNVDLLPSDKQEQEQVEVSPEGWDYEFKWKRLCVSTSQWGCGVVTPAYAT